MNYRNLGRTGVKVSPFCLGCGNYGERIGEKEAFEIIDRAIEAGINILDTANVYGRGKNEEFVGKALQQNGKRSHIVLATKVFGQMDDDDPNSWRSHRRHITEQCHASLQRLRTDYIDLYQIHQPTSEIPIDETLRALEDLIQAGKVRYIGTPTTQGGLSSSEVERCSGKIYDLEQNELQFENISIEFADKGSTLIVRDERGEHTIQVGFDTWQRGTTNMRGHGEESIAACCAWIAEDTYEERICFYESEFCPVFRLHYTSDGLLVEVEPNVSWGSTTARKITGKPYQDMDRGRD